MEIKAPYLEAIQAIAGTTPGEKLKTINIIARQIAQAENPAGQSASAYTPIPDVPGPSKPLVRVEVAKILHRYDGIVEALKSEDMTVLGRAFQAKWFFDGSDTSLVNAEYFLENVFPEVSLFARTKIVKNLAIYLKNTSVAADFFLTLVRQYGVGQATPLLMACDEDFAFKMIVENKIVLSSRMVKKLYQKYPNSIVKYLMMSKPDDHDVRNLYHINILDYIDFLPVVAHDRFDDFMAIYQMHDCSLDVNLGRRAAESFVKTHLDLLMEKPDRYLKLVSLKIVTEKLSVDDFSIMFKNLLPPEKDSFRYSAVKDYLQYYIPEGKRIYFILNTFRHKYGTDLLKCKNLVDSDLMKDLPTADRVEQARLKLADDKDWHLYDRERSWRCYLPTSESIPVITKEIAKSSDANKRGQLLRQLIHTCKINDDKDALLTVLNYIYDRHRNDLQYIFYDCLSDICFTFDLVSVSSSHWEVLNKYIKLAELQDNLLYQQVTISRILEAALHYCTLKGLPMDDYIRIFVDIKTKMRNSSWNILTQFPDLERKLLDLFIDVVPKQYPFDRENKNTECSYVIFNLASSLWDFNDRNKASNGKFKRLSVNDYPWLLEKIEVYFLRENDTVDKWLRDCFLERTKENERDLYHLLMPKLEKFWDCCEKIIYEVLKEDSQRVMDNWEQCLEKVQDEVTPAHRVSLFIVKSRWYQQLPILFFKKTLETQKDPETCAHSMAILAFLADGETYAKIIEAFIPIEEKMDVDHLAAKSTYSIQLAIVSSLRNVHPPVSLDIIARFCVGDYLQMASRSLTSVCRRLPVAKVIPFAKTLTNRRVSVMKHGIRLMYLAAPLEEIYAFLTDLWNTEGHTSIRGVVFKKMYDLFCKQPDSRSWRMIRTCLDHLNINDDEEIFRSLTRLSTIPNEFLYEYIKSVITVLKSMEQKADDPKLYNDLSCQLIRNIDGPIVQILPEKYCQGLIKQYLFVFDYKSDIFQAGMYLTVKSYLLSSKKYKESRFKFIGDLFRESVKQYWDEPHPKCFKFYPMNFMTHRFFGKINDMTNDRYDVRIFESLLEIFESVLQPHQDAVSYLDLVYSIEYQKSETSQDFGTRIARKISELIETFSPEYVISMSHSLSSFMSSRTFSKSESDEERLMTIIEVFANSGAIHCGIFAADMLFNNKSKSLNERHKTLIRVLRNFHHPGISCYLNEHLATSEFSEDTHEQSNLSSEHFEYCDIE